MTGSRRHGFLKVQSTATVPPLVEKILLPMLRPGDMILDNLGSHRGQIVRQLIRSAGARLFFLPKYSPDLNPIEQVFAKLKHFLRNTAARTVEALCLAIAEVLPLFTPKDNYLANAGYAGTYFIPLSVANELGGSDHYAPMVPFTDVRQETRMSAWWFSIVWGVGCSAVIATSSTRRAISHGTWPSMISHPGLSNTVSKLLVID